MTNIVMMKIGDRWKDLPHDDSGLRLCQALFLNNKIEEFSPFAYLSNQIDSFLGLIDLI